MIRYIPKGWEIRYKKMVVVEDDDKYTFAIFDIKLPKYPVAYDLDSFQRNLHYAMDEEFSACNNVDYNLRINPEGMKVQLLVFDAELAKKLADAFGDGEQFSEDHQKLWIE